MQGNFNGKGKDNRKLGKELDDRKDIVGLGRGGAKGKVANRRE